MRQFRIISKIIESCERILISIKSYRIMRSNSYFEYRILPNRMKQHRITSKYENVEISNFTVSKYRNKKYRGNTASKHRNIPHDGYIHIHTSPEGAHEFRAAPAPPYPSPRRFCSSLDERRPKNQTEHHQFIHEKIRRGIARPRPREYPPPLAPPKVSNTIHTR